MKYTIEKCKYCGAMPEIFTLKSVIKGLHSSEPVELSYLGCCSCRNDNAILIEEPVSKLLAVIRAWNKEQKHS